MRNAVITGWGSCLPPAVLTNADLETVTDTSDEWITTRTGIKERRISHVETSDLAAVAGLRALAAAGREPAEVDLVLLATCTPDRLATTGQLSRRRRSRAMPMSMLFERCTTSGRASEASQAMSLSSSLA